MRYKSQPSATDKCLDTTTSTLTYFRKRPISLIVLLAVFIWMILVFRWSSGSSSLESPTKSQSNDNIPIQPDKDSPKRNAQGIVIAPNGAPTAQKPKLDAGAIANKVSNAKKVLVTYGQNCCTAAKKRMCESAFKNGEMTAPRDECHAYDATVMDDEFQKKNINILKQGRGAGYWLWKPYIIYKWLTDDTMEDDNSYLIYSDAGAQVIGDVGHVLRFMEENDDIYKGVLFFGVGFDQQNFCKRDAFILQDCDREECYKAMQINAFSGFFRKCEFSRMVVKKWLDDCQDERILTDISNKMGKPNLSGFRDHRHDQAAITNIMVANGWNYDTSNGPILDKVFHHDRFKA